MLKKNLVGIILLVISLLLMATIVSGTENVSQMISVVFNSINIEVDGKPMQVDNISYNGTTYVPIRAAAEMLGKQILWDPETNTANITEKKEPGWCLIGSKLIQPEEMSWTNGFTGTNEKAETSLTLKKNVEGELLISQTYKYLPEWGGKLISEKECSYKWSNPPALIKEGESFSTTASVTPITGDNFSISGQVHSFNKLNKTGEWNQSYRIESSTPETIMSYPFGKGSVEEQETITISFLGMAGSFKLEYVYEWRE